MGYNEEQTRSYNSMMYAWGTFEEMKQSLSKEKCSAHNKNLKLGASWEREYDLDIYRLQILLYRLCKANCKQIYRKTIICYGNNFK